MKLSVFCGVSVDGFLARPNDALDFLKTGEQEPHGFEEFFGSVDVVVIGRKTLEVVRTFGKSGLSAKVADPPSSAFCICVVGCNSSGS